MTIILTIIIVFVLIAWISSHWDNIAFNKVTFSRDLDRFRIHSGESITLMTEVVNNKVIPLPWLTIETTVPEVFSFKGTKLYEDPETHATTYKVVTSLLFYEKVKRYDTFTCSKRGSYRLYDVQLKAGDFFGNKIAIKKYKNPLTVLVHPQTHAIKDLVIQSNNYQGELSVKRWIIPDPIQVVGARDYSATDAFHTIDWKSSARMSRLQVKVFDHTADPSVMIMMDVQTSQVHWHDIDFQAVEEGFTLAASIAEDAMINHLPVGLCVNSLDMNSKSFVVVEPSASHHQKTRLLDTLSNATPHRGKKITDLLRERLPYSGRESVYIIISAYIHPEMIQMVNYYANQGYTIKVMQTGQKELVSGFSPKVELFKGFKVKDSSKGGL